MSALHTWPSRRHLRDGLKSRHVGIFATAVAGLALLLSWPAAAQTTAPTAAPAAAQPGPIPERECHLKCCKVAGPGVAVGTPFTFDCGGTKVAVPAGPAPGGYCMLDGVHPLNSIVKVIEAIPQNGTAVESITTDPPGAKGPTNLAAGSVELRCDTPITEVIYTDKRTGHIEICKKAEEGVKGDVTFTVEPGNVPVTVPVGACSSCLEVAAGEVTITETTPGADITACTTIDPTGDCVVTNPRTVTVKNVAPGVDCSNETVVNITNRRK